jgi:hypothetical protein
MSNASRLRSVRSPGAAEAGQLLLSIGKPAIERGISEGKAKRDKGQGKRDKGKGRGLSLVPREV